MNTFIRFPGGKAKAFTLSYDDGQRQDKRLAEIFNKNGLKCTFNINTGTYGDPEKADLPNGLMSLAEMQETYRGHEVAVHALTHPYLEQLPAPLIVEEVLGDRRNIERDFGVITRGMAYPFGTYNDTVVNTIAACGIAYSRTVQATKSFAVTTDWLRLHPTCHHADKDLFTLFDRFFGKHSGRGPWLFYLWGHSFELDWNREHNSWEHAEKFSGIAGGHEDVWYATNIEVYDYVQACRSLIFSANADTVHNPAAIEVFFSTGEKTISVKPGETVKL